MKKRIQLYCILLILLLVGVVIFLESEKKVWIKINNVGEPFVVLKTNNGEQKIDLWENKEEKTQCYFFLPSFVRNREVYFEKVQEYHLVIDDKVINEYQGFRWEPGDEYSIKIISNGIGQVIREFSVIFEVSDNIPALFIETISETNKCLLENKDYEESGNIEIVNVYGTSEYKGSIEKISGRGNSTWTYPKKPFSFSLVNAYSLCGLDQGKSWRLLAGVREKGFMSNKIAMDIGKILNMPYSPNGTWVDLYLNGEYLGIYLLCEAVTVGDGRVEIFDLGKENKVRNSELAYIQSYQEQEMKWCGLDDYGEVTGGYLLEKDDYYYDEKVSGFITDEGNKFVIRDPEYASKLQVEYISKFIQNVELALEKDIDNYCDYIDEQSFIQKFLVDEITMNFDAYYTSCYFYKDRTSELLYAGPLWDYDSAFGYMGGMWKECDWLIIEQMRLGSVSWFAKLYNNPEYYSAVVKNYQKIVPELYDLVNDRIDGYANYIRASAHMNGIRWSEMFEVKSDSDTSMLNFDNEVNELKYFLSARLNYLDQRWGR